MKRNAWDSVTHILQKRAIFEENRAFFCRNRQFLIDFRPKTLGKHSTGVSDTRGA